MADGLKTHMTGLGREVLTKTLLCTLLAYTSLTQCTQLNMWTISILLTHKWSLTTHAKTPSPTDKFHMSSKSCLTSVRIQVLLPVFNPLKKKTIFLMELQRQTEFSQSILENHCTACLSRASSLSSSILISFFPQPSFHFYVKLMTIRTDHHSEVSYFMNLSLSQFWVDHQFTLNINTLSDDTSLGFCIM